MNADSDHDTLDGPPPGAVEDVTEYWPNGTRKLVSYLVEKKAVWSRFWSESGRLLSERGLRDCQMHGPFRTWFDNGQLCEESFYIDGKEHGIARQWDEDGRLIGRYVMVHGTGADQWFQAPGALLEERQYLDGERHGFERDYWFDGKGDRVSEEKHYKRGVEHGIHRQWGSRGGVKRGFPHFYIDGERVTKRRYQKAYAGDTTLPPYRPEDDDDRREPLQPFLPLPPEEEASAS